jgi:hypothetical protein
MKLDVVGLLETDLHVSQSSNSILFIRWLTDLLANSLWQS